MTTLQLLAQAAVFASFLGVFITIVAYFNGKHIKENTAKTNELIERTAQRTQELIEKMDERSQETHKIIEKMDERTQETHRILAKMDERAEQRHKEIMMKS